MTELIELAERCEQATGPEHEVDVEIHKAISGFPPRIGGVGWPKGALVVPAFPGWKPLPAYTASLDAAMTLVPEGWRLVDLCETIIEGDLPWYARLLEKRFDGLADRAHSDGATAALALCGAALRALSQANRQEAV